MNQHFLTVHQFLKNLFLKLQLFSQNFNELFQDSQSVKKILPASQSFNLLIDSFNVFFSYRYF